MKLSYSKLIELFEQENIPDIIGYIDDFSLLANSLIKKGEFDKLDKIGADGVKAIIFHTINYLRQLTH